MSDVAGLELVPLRPAHLPAAAALVCANYARQRQTVPALPACYEQPAALLPRLRDLARRAPGVVALRDGRLVGFLSAYLLDNFRRHSSAFSPEWANAIEPNDPAPIYAALYASLARRWVAEGYRLHGLSLFAEPVNLREAWHWLGFGLSAADAVRDLRPLGAVPVGLRISRAGPADLSELIKLDDALHRHLVDAPLFLPLSEPNDHSELSAELADTDYAFWTAWQDERAVAFMKFGPTSDHACLVIRDPGTTSISAAFTLPEARGRGVATALLDAGLAWARATCYQRCAVDFEPMNAPAARFWGKYFQLVCLSQLRLIEGRG